MSQIWKDEKVIPVTPIEVSRVAVVQVKNKEKDGYEAVQVGFDETKKKLKKPQAGHLKNIGNFRKLKEFRLDKANLNVGDAVTLDQFSEGDKVKVSGLEKGRGFQGVVKRHGFHGGPKSHGQKDRHRAPGSIGATAPQRVMPGRKMAGHMGYTRTTIKNLTIALVNKEKNVIYIKGAVPGMKGSFVEIRK